MSNGGGGVIIEPTNPLPQQYPVYYTTVGPVNGDNVVTTAQTTVTISGETDAAAGDQIVTILEPYAVSVLNGGSGGAVAASDLGAVTDLNQQDGLGNELGAWSTTISTDGLAPGLYVAESFVAFPTQDGGFVYEDGGSFGKEIVSVAPTDQQTTPFSTDASSAELSTDGRYLVYTDGQTFERDLQTGATTVIPDGSTPAGTFATNHLPDGVADDGSINYQTFTSTDGAYTFGTVIDFDQNIDNGRNNPVPVVTDTATGDQSVLGQFGGQRFNIGAAIAASDNGNVVLSEQTVPAMFFVNNNFGYGPDPSIDVSYLAPAPTLTLDPVNGGNPFGAFSGAADVTIGGTSDAIGQTVEIDFGQAGNAVGTATVVDDGKGDGNGTWSFTFDPAAQNITDSSLFIEASVSSAQGTPARTDETASVNTVGPVVEEVFAETASYSRLIGAGQTVTIDLITNVDIAATGMAGLILSNGAVAAFSRSFTFGDGFLFPITHYVEFTYTPSLGDASGPLSIAGLSLPNGATLNDAAGDVLGGPLDQSLDLTLQTAPVLNGGGVYNTALPSITGTADAGDTVTLMENGNAIGTITLSPATQTQSLGGFDITVSQILSQGQHVLTAIATDGNGNVSAVSAPITITIDSITPTLAISTAGALTNQRIQKISGTIDAGDGGSVVSLYDGTQLLGTVKSAADGSFSRLVTLPATQGDHVIAAAAANDAGDVGTSAAITFTLDTLAPVVAITAIDGLGTQPTQTVTGTVDAADGGSVVSLYDGTQLLGTVQSAQDGSWNLAVALPTTEGVHRITAKATDAASNTSSSAATDYTIDTIAPVLAILTGGGLTNQLIQKVTGTVDAADGGSVVSLYDGAQLLGTVKSAANGSWSRLITLPANQGDHVITAKATDGAGNIGSSSPITYTLDTIAPVLTVATFGGLTNQRIQKISGTVDAADGGGLVSLYDGTQLLGTVPSAADGSWSRLITLSATQGDHAITATATDAADNTGSGFPITFTLDTVAPTLKINNAGGLTNLRTHTISGTIGLADVGVEVSIYDGAKLLGEVVTSATGTWKESVTLSASQGAHVITVQAPDNAGNQGVSAPVTYTLDTIAPKLRITSGKLFRTTYSIKGTIDRADSRREIAIYDNKHFVGYARPDTSGYWSLQIKRFPRGKHVIEAIVSDAAGNKTISNIITITNQATPPAHAPALRPELPLALFMQAIAAFPKDGMPLAEHDHGRGMAAHEPVVAASPLHMRS